MADKLTLTANAFVKWPVSGGTALGKVVQIKDDSATVETPTAQLMSIAVGTLIPISKHEYSKSLQDIISNVQEKLSVASAKADVMPPDDECECTQVDSNMNDKTQSEIASVKAELDAAKAKIVALEAEKVEYATKARLASEAQTATASELAIAQKSASEATAEITKIRKESLGLARYTELKTFEAADSLGANQAEASTLLADMDEKSYKSVVQIARSGFEKVKAQLLKAAEAGKTGNPQLTDQTRTGLPKLTDQTHTSLTKLTEAEVKAEASKQAEADKAKDAESQKASAEAIAKAATEKDAALATAGTSKNDNAAVLSKLFASSMGRKTKKVVEKK